jgi:cysteine desulfurase family protein (TIGR01976 family)
MSLVAPNTGMSIDLEVIRQQFPALSDADDGIARVYFDNPAGTQVPQQVADRMTDCLLHANANIGGYFRTSELATAIATEARQAMADFVNAPSPDEIIFGQNMTSITFHVARSIGRHLKAGDEIIVTHMDHDANVEPWVLLARDHDLTIRWLPFNTESYEFELDQLDKILNEKTRLVCVGGASNLTGTINDVTAICARARDAGAWTYIDAVQSAPHVATDVQAIGCDFLVCSAYKFFGPHQGILWGRTEVFEHLEPYRVRPAPAELPWSFEPGTQSHEGMAGTNAAVDYFAWVGATMAGAESTSSNNGLPVRTRAVHAAFASLFAHEKDLAAHLINGLQALPGIKIHGVTAPDALDRRVSTVSFTHDTHAPASIAEALAKRNIFVWNGHNYALELVKALGIFESGGTVRVGAVHYNSISEIDLLLNALEDVLG